MDTSWYVQGASTAERMRELIRRKGMTFAGQPLWTPGELATVQALHPDLARISKTLGRRSYYAVRDKAQEIGLARRKHVWTQVEISMLRRLYPGASRSELRATFPNFTREHLTHTANYHGIYRGRPALRKTGFTLLDEVRRRAFELGYTMMDLDLIAHTGRYFRNGNWRRGKKMEINVGRAVQAMGGHFYAEWPEAQVDAHCTAGRIL